MKNSGTITNSIDRLKILKLRNNSGKLAMRWLHDFTRRGKGSVSKLPFEEVFIDRSDSNEAQNTTLAEINGNVVKIGGNFNIMSGSDSNVTPISSISPIKQIKSTKVKIPSTRRLTTPFSSSTVAHNKLQRVKVEEGTLRRQFQNATGKMHFDFEQLASLLQQMINKQKGTRNYAAMRRELSGNDREVIHSSNTLSVSDVKPIELSYRRFNSGSKLKNSDGIFFRRLQMSEATKALDGNQTPIIINKRKMQNGKMILPRTALATSEVQNPMIYVVREGSIMRRDENNYEFVSSITLIIDDGKRILVDTGLSTDISGRTWMMQRLSELGSPPPAINYVITTHGHSDHSGNTNHFPDAFHYAGRFMHVGGKSNFSRIFKDDVEKLTRNVYLLKTSGHTADEIAVLINNTSFFGTVIVSGDIFMRREDIKDSTLWKQLAFSEVQQDESRRRLLCLANCIIPGHGPLFRIVSSMKREFNCHDNY